MAERKTFTVNTNGRGLNVRKAPSKDAPIVGILRDGEKVAVNSKAEAPDGWKAINGEGYVMTEYLI